MMQLPLQNCFLWRKKYVNSVLISPLALYWGLQETVLLCEAFS